MHRGRILLKLLNACYKHVGALYQQNTGISRRAIDMTKKTDQLTLRYRTDLGCSCKIVRKNPIKRRKTKDIETRPQKRVEKQALVEKDEAKRFMKDCLVKAGACENDAQEMATLLAEADYRGHFSQGMKRLDMYVNDLQNKRCEGTAKPEILKESLCTAVVDGHNGLDGPIGNFCMRLAMKKAQVLGVSWVVAKGSYNFKIPGWYAMMAQDECLLGMSFSNTSVPFMDPTTTDKTELESLTGMPISKKDESFMVHMFTLAEAFGKVHLKKRNSSHEGVMNAGGALSLEVGDLISAHKRTKRNKGYGGLFEMLSDAPSRSHSGTTINKDAPNLAQFFLAVVPCRFSPNYFQRMADLIKQLKSAEAMNESMPILIAGDTEWQHMKKVKLEGGIRYPEHQIKTNYKLAKKLNVKEMQLVK